MPVAELQGQLIGGERVGALDGERFEVLDPSTGQCIRCATVITASDGVLTSVIRCRSQGARSSWIV